LQETFFNPIKKGFQKWYKNQRRVSKQTFDMRPIPYLKLRGDAIEPERMTPHSAGLDLFAINSKKISANGGRTLFKTGIAIEIPRKHYGRIAPRSGLALNNGLDVLGGVVDFDYYPGEIKVLLINHGKIDLHIVKGDRIAQLIIARIHMGELEETNIKPETRRGGFGSTGR
jgi:dUTP pyrophosphatase